MPVVSEKQRRAMWAAAKGRSTLGIPKKVGEEFVGADDADLRTLYVSRKLMNAADVLAWARGQGFENPDLAETMHVTIAYSAAPIDWDAVPPIADSHVVHGGEREVEELGEGAIVLRFESPELAARWKQFRDAGASWDHPSYKPHVTITHEGDSNLGRVVPYAGVLEFGPERFAEVGGKAKAAMDAKLLIAFDRVLPGILMAGISHALRARTGLAFDKGSVRSYRKDGQLDVETSNLSKACVNPYVGHEIPGWQELGLKPDKIYKLLRDPDELAKAAPTFNNLPILTEHVAVSADDHKPDLVVGTTGSGAEYAAPFLRNNLVLWARRGIDLVESEEQKELSSSYHYRADMTPGEYEGESYDGVMRDIVGNHVALVKQGRAGDDVVVGDSMEMVLMAAKSLKFSHTASVALGALAVFMAPKLAMDAKVDISPALEGVTAKNFKEKKPAIADAIKKLTSGKLAKDESLEGVIQLLDKLENVGVGDEAGTEPNSALPLAKITPDDDEALDASPMDAAIAFAKSKLAGEDLAQFEQLCAGSAMDAEETDEEKEARLKKEKDKAANDEPPPFKGRPDVGKGPPVTKKAMDAAIDAAVQTAEKNAAKKQADIRDAERAVRPYVGEMALAQDSAAAVYRTALKQLGVAGAEDIHESALPTILAMQPKPGAKQNASAKVAMDAAGAKGFAERFPETARIRTL